MSLKVVVYGGRLDLADELEEEFHAQAKDAVYEAAGLLLGEVERVLHLRIGTLATAAPPGEPPEFDTGALAASFKRLPPRIKGRIASSGIGSDDPGANRLEFGKTDIRGIRTMPHPFVAPAIKAMDEPIGRLLQARLG
jgi:hypothetical protein